MKIRKRTIRRYLAMFLVLVLCMSMSLTAFADDIPAVEDVNQADVDDSNNSDDFDNPDDDGSLEDEGGIGDDTPETEPSDDDLENDDDLSDDLENQEEDDSSNDDDLPDADAPENGGQTADDTENNIEDVSEEKEPAVNKEEIPEEVRQFRSLLDAMEAFALTEENQEEYVALGMQASELLEILLEKYYGYPGMEDDMARFQALADKQSGGAEELAQVSGESFTVNVVKVVNGQIADSKNLTSKCLQSTGHSGYNHSTNLRTLANQSGFSGYKGYNWSKNTTVPARYTSGLTPNNNYAAVHYNITGKAPYKADETLFLFFEDSKTFTLNYNANGGSGAPAQQKETGTGSSYNFTISSTEPTRTDYIFKGWNTSSTATSASYRPNGTISVTGTTTLYAVWEKKPEQVKLTYNDGETPCYAVETYDKGTDVTIKDCPNDRGDDWEFLGWSTDKNAKEADWSQGDKMRLNADTTLYAIWKENAKPEIYTVTYTDGVEDEEVFEDQVYPDLEEGDTTPKFDGGDPTRDGYTFTGWDPKVNETVTGNATYVAQWEKNPEPETYTVTYTDGVEDEEVFTDQVYPDLEEGTATPEFAGGDPTRDGYTFTGWAPEVSDTVTGNATYIAQWEKNPEPETYTVTYTDGVEDEEVFTDQVYGNLAKDSTTPEFAGGDPTRDGYTFTGWAPEVSDTVTGNATYVAQWEKNPDPDNPNPDNPDPDNPNPDNPDPDNPNPDNPDPDNPTPDNPDPDNPDPDNPTPDNPDPDNPDPGNPNPENPDPDNPTPDTPGPDEPEPNPNPGPDEPEPNLNPGPDEPEPNPNPAPEPEQPEPVAPPTPPTRVIQVVPEVPEVVTPADADTLVVIPDEDVARAVVYEMVQNPVTEEITYVPNEEIPVLEEIPAVVEINSPDTVIILDEEVPQAFVKVKDPATEKYVYIPEEEVPLANIGAPETGDVSGNHWMMLFMMSLGGMIFLLPELKRGKKNR